MHQQDQELLDKQLGHLTPPPRSDGVMILAILAVFFGGLALGGFLVGYNGGSTRTTSNSASAALFLPGDVGLVLRQ
jgi:hypothetical protein